MSQEKYSLSWHNYSDHLRSMMKELMMNEDFADVTLVTEDKKQIKANIHVLIACSPVFKNILKKENNLSPIMYLRSIQYSEMESIMQFIYLGEATFYEKRLEEFLAVAKSLEIKGLYSAENETNDVPAIVEPINEPSPDEAEEQIVIFDQNPKQALQEHEVVDVNRKYECEQCQKSLSSHAALYRHKRSAHQGVRYACDQCDHQFKDKENMRKHILSKHKGVRYACDHCDFQATLERSLSRHIESQHEGIRYDCDHCDYQATERCHLKTHIKRKHILTH